MLLTNLFPSFSFLPRDILTVYVSRNAQHLVTTTTNSTSGSSSYYSSYGDSTPADDDDFYGEDDDDDYDEADDSDDVYIMIELGIYDKFAMVLEVTPLCALSIHRLEQRDENYYTYNATTTDSYNNSTESACPLTPDSTYNVKTSVVVPSSLLEDGSLQYTPDVKITFTAGSNADNQVVLGCATTGTLAMSQHAHSKAVHGLWALIISTLLFMMAFASLLLWSHARKKRLQKRHLQRAARRRNKNHHHPQCFNYSNNADDAAAAAAAADGMVQHQYRYFRSLPNGEIVPLPSATATRTRPFGGGHQDPVPSASAAATETSSTSGSSTNTDHIPMIGAARRVMDPDTEDEASVTARSSSTRNLHQQHPLPPRPPRQPTTGTHSSLPHLPPEEDQLVDIPTVPLPPNTRPIL